MLIGNRSALAATGLLLALVTAAPAALAFPGNPLRGDINADGRVNLGDSILLLRHLRGDAGAQLDARGLYAADVAPLDAGGASQPDGEVDPGDLAVLTRIVSGAIGPDSPTLSGLPGNTNGIFDQDVTGTTSADGTVHLFATDGGGTVAHVDTTSTTSGSFSFSGIPLPFDGSNEFFVVLVDPNGLASAPSLALQASWSNPASCSPSGTPSDPLTISTPTVWTAHCGDYQIPSGGLTVDTGGRFILGPGVTLRFPANTRLLVKGGGALEVLGAQTQKALLTAATTTWDGVKFSGSADSMLTQVDIDKLRRDGGLRLIELSDEMSGAAHVTLRDATVTPEDGSGSTIHAAFGSGELTLDFSTITGSGGNGVVLWTKETSRIRHTTISGFYTCLEIDRNTRFHRVEHTTINSCTNTGIRLGGNSRAEIAPGNLITNNPTGISTSSIGCGSRNCYRPDLLPTINDSTFMGNTVNIDTGASTHWQDPDHSERPVIDARYNYWGATTPLQISDRIEDVLDSLVPAGSNSGDPVLDGNGPLVDYTPFLDDYRVPLC